MSIKLNRKLLLSSSNLLMSLPKRSIGKMHLKDYESKPYSPWELPKLFSEMGDPLTDTSLDSKLAAL